MVTASYIGLIIGFGCLGFIKAAQVRKRPRELREISNALALLDTEIVWGITPLPQAFFILKERTDPPWQQFFAELEERLKKGESAYSAWKNTITKQKRRFCLNSEDWKVILDIGKGLGRSDSKQQHKQLELAQKHLALNYENASYLAEKKAKMWSYLGFLGGMAVVIFMI